MIVPCPARCRDHLYLHTLPLRICLYACLACDWGSSTSMCDVLWLSRAVVVAQGGWLHRYWPWALGRPSARQQVHRTHAHGRASGNPTCAQCSQYKSLVWHRMLRLHPDTHSSPVVQLCIISCAAPLYAPTSCGTHTGTALATSGAAIAIGSIFGGAGAGLLAYKTNRRYGMLQEFTFMHVHGEKDNALAVTIVVPGWCTTSPGPPDSRYVGIDFLAPVASLDSLSEVYSLVWESRKLYALHVALVTFLTTTLAKQTAVTVLKQTVLVSLVAAIALPATLISASDLIDNPWGVCTEAAYAAGCELANVLLSRVQGARPVVLTGYSMGALVIFHALQQMARRSEAVGIVQDVHLFGLPATGQSGAWDAIMPLISGRVSNFFSQNDTFLKLMLRGLSVEKCVAGIEGVNHVRCRNVDASDFISVHSDYAVQMPKLLQLAGLSTTYNDKPFVGNVGDRVAVDGYGLGAWVYKR